MEYRTKPFKQLFQLKDFTPDGDDCWKAETLVGMDPIVLGVTLLHSDALLVEMTQDSVKSATAMSPLTIKLAKAGVECAGLNKVGQIQRTVKLGLFMGDVSRVLDVWTDAPTHQPEAATR